MASNGRVSSMNGNYETHFEHQFSDARHLQFLFSKIMQLESSN